MLSKYLVASEIILFFYSKTSLEWVKLHAKRLPLTDYLARLALYRCVVENGHQE